MTDGKMWLPPHLSLLNRELLKVAFGQTKRLMVTMPPRHGKSEMCSHYFPAWFLGTWPDRRVILCSYEADFAQQWGRKVRDTLRDANERGIYAVSMRDDVSAQKRWETGAGGGMTTAGVGGSITGRGGNLVVIDDPVKNAEDASSQTKREAAWDWYGSTLYTRLEPNAALLLIMTRWHEDDLGGRLLAQEPEDGIPWQAINLPAIADVGDALGREPGAPLWPERYDTQALAGIREQLGSYWWSALYQQRPAPREGGMFKRAWFRIVDQGPKHAHRVRYWDRAASVDGDYTVGARLAVNGDGVYYVEHVCRFRGTPHENERTIRQTAETDGEQVGIVMEQEPGSSGKDTIATYRRLLSEFNFRGDRPTGPKELRADAFAAVAEAGNVCVVRGSWNSEYLDELASFPQCTHDDQVDATAGAYRQIASRHNAIDIATSGAGYVARY